MADLRDEHGNPIQLTDEHGNPVQLTDEYGNPMHLRGVAVSAGAGGETDTAVHGATTGLGGETAAAMQGDYVPEREAGGDQVTVVATGTALTGVAVMLGVVVEEKIVPLGEQRHRSTSSSSSSSSEDDGQGGRRKKKGLTAKIKEKLGRGKHKNKNKDEHPHAAAAAAGAHMGAHEQEKKSVMEKIKEKLPAHHAGPTH